MKKIEILFTTSAVTLCSLVAWYAFGRPIYDYETLKATLTAIHFEQDSLQLGEIKYGSRYKAIFRFINTGTFPLLIHDIHTSCGCTSVKWSKDPVKPGASGEINITFAPNSLGKFNKTIEVLCNVQENKINLKLCGSVTE